MKINKLLIVLGIFSATLVAALVITNGNAFAATKTWNGATNNNFSTGTNWTPSGAPTTGDDLVFDTGTSVTNSTPVNDISGLSVASVTFTGTGIGGVNQVDTSTPLTVTNMISDSATVTAIPKLYGEIIIGGSVTLRGVQFSDPSPGYINLNNNTLTVVDPLSDNIISYSFSAPITGNGTFVIDAPSVADLQFNVPNTYSGNTLYMSGNILSVGLTPNQVFGTSTITIYPGSSLTLALDASDDGQSWDNPIIISETDQSSWDDEYYALFVHSSTPISINIPNITLMSNSRIAANNVNVNLAGIDAGDFCIEYSSYSTFTSSFLPNAVFTNGPAHCTLSETSASTGTVPRTPNTGFNLIKNNPLATIAITLVTTFTIVIIARKRASFSR